MEWQLREEIPARRARRSRGLRLAYVSDLAKMQIAPAKNSLAATWIFIALDTRVECACFTLSGVSFATPTPSCHGLNDP